MLLPISTILLTLIVALPLAAVFLRVAASGALGPVLGRTIVVEALKLSLFTTTCTVGLSLLLGTPAAYFLARHKFRGQSLLESVLELPIVLPPAVAGIGLLMAFGRKGILGE